MFKIHAIAMLAGAALLFGGQSIGEAAGVDLDPGLERGAVIATATPFDLLSNPDGAQFFQLVPGFLTGGGQSTAGTVSVAPNVPFVGFNLTVGSGLALFGSTDGTSATEVFMEDTTSVLGNQDLIEFLFTLSINDGSLTASNLVLVSFVGEFGSDPFGSPSTLGSAATGAASLTLTAVNQVPLPAGLVLLLSALGGLVLVRRRAA